MRSGPRILFVIVMFLQVAATYGANLVGDTASLLRDASSTLDENGKILTNVQMDYVLTIGVGSSRSTTSYEQTILWNGNAFYTKLKPLGIAGSTSEEVAGKERLTSAVAGIISSTRIQASDAAKKNNRTILRQLGLELPALPDQWLKATLVSTPNVQLENVLAMHADSLQYRVDANGKLVVSMLTRNPIQLTAEGVDLVKAEAMLRDGQVPEEEIAKQLADVERRRLEPQFVTVIWTLDPSRRFCLESCETRYPDDSRLSMIKNENFELFDGVAVPLPRRSIFEYYWSTIGGFKRDAKPLSFERYELRAVTRSAAIPSDFVAKYIDEHTIEIDDSPVEGKSRSSSKESASVASVFVAVVTSFAGLVVIVILVTLGVLLWKRKSCR